MTSRISRATTPPKWLIDESPDILPLQRDGKRIPFGSRRHYDFCHPKYRAESRRISEYYTRQFGSHPAVVAWQTDNEFGCHNSVFQFSPYFRSDFRNWLKEKYQEQIALLNEAWFTCFWSQGYRSFDEIDLPFTSWADQNPHLELDFRRFCNDACREFQREQCEIIRTHSPGRPITHNFMTLFNDLDPWLLSKDLDLAGFDHYQMEPEPHPITSAWQFSLMHSLKPNQKFLVLEQQPVQVNWQSVNRRFTLDWLFLWGFQSAWNGALGMMYFSWQRMYGGAEQYHDGIVPHDIRIQESPQEKILRAKNSAFKTIANQFSLTQLPNPKADVVVVHDFESLWSHEITAQSTLYTTRKQLDFIAQFCHEAALGMIFAPSIAAACKADSKHRLLVLPGHAFEFSADELVALKKFLQEGGKILSFPRTAMKLRNNQMTPLPLSIFDPTDFHFEEYGALLENEREWFSFLGKGSKSYEGGLWAEKLRITNPNWQTLATFKKGLYQGSPAIIQRAYHNGSWTHLAICPTATSDLFTKLLAALSIQPLASSKGSLQCQLFPLAAPDGRCFLAAVNFGSTKAEIAFTAPHTSIYKSLVIALDSDLELIIDKEKLTKKNGQKARQTRLTLPGRAVGLLEYRSDP